MGMIYTPEVVQDLVNRYRSGEGVEDLAKTLGVPNRSVIAKLSSLGVYQKKSYLNKRGEVPVKKSQHIEDLSILLGVDVERLESLEKCNKGVLVLIIDALRKVEG